MRNFHIVRRLILRLPIRSVNPPFFPLIRKEFEELLLEDTDYSGMKLTTILKILPNAKILLSVSYLDCTGWSCRDTAPKWQMSADKSL